MYISIFFLTIFYKSTYVSLLYVIRVAAFLNHLVPIFVLLTTTRNLKFKKNNNKTKFNFLYYCGLLRKITFFINFIVFYAVVDC